MADDEPIPLFEIDWDRQDVLNVVDSVTRGSYWAKGPYVDKFEEQLESYLGVEHAVTYNSGTTALVGALHAAGVEENDEVIVPAFTFIATANAVRLVGAEPIFVDIERNRYGLDPDSVQEAITERTTAIMPIHSYGKPFLMDDLRTVADEYNIPLIEDAAEAFGAHDGNQMAGTVGDAAALSFCQNKIIATGEGGAVVTDDPELAERLRLYRSHGRSSSDYFDASDSGEYITLGTNNRMADVVAAIGAGQMTRVEDIIERRRSVAIAYHDALADVDGIILPSDPTDGRHVYQIYTITCESPAIRESILDTLDARDVSAKIYWDPPVHRTTFYGGDDDTNLPVSDDLASRVLSLPMHPNLSPKSIARVADAVEAGVASHRN
ncbi:DegT/DnrJ/EryC1/StrS family aminotransferase [Halorubrum sp. LN27]|uniref:DegT/DnrJ/EryC1/StrS family aminotransferase n=1 Tax=Halorubrum sp. LN27 TaxID=2801032 RepID=UPI00190B1167|nr:DegT/DnrJ/EryC1/StrS family aminotransferase [Halorubrum sp. LN27]